MIHNFAAYNAWKRATLDRVSAKYRNLFLRAFRAHLQKIAPEIERALLEGRRTINVNAEEIGAELMNVLLEHLYYTTKVGVSDGIREVTPEQKLATWVNFPWSMPVEDTFTNLAERKQRDRIIEKMMKGIRQKYSAGFAELINLEKERYLKNIKTVFKTVADDYYAKEDSDYTPDIVKDVIGRVFDKTKKQAEVVFRTETTRFFNDARVAYFKDNTDVDFVRLFAVTDGRISDICESRSNYVIPLAQAGQNKFKPPFHPNCRTIQSPLISYLKADAEVIRKNLGSEFGTVKVEHTKKGEVIEVDFTGRRAAPNVPLPSGWG